MTSARIAGWGVALPEKVVTNDDLAAVLDTSDEWIRERSGILERRIGGTTSGLAIDAGAAALRHAGIAASDVGLLIVCTSTPDQQMPATASTVQHALGLQCGAFDLNAACSGFVYGLVTAYQFVAGGVDRVLLIGSETMSRIVDWDERTTAVLFGDGAGRSCSRPAKASHRCSDGTSAATVPCARSSTVTSAATCAWRAKRSSARLFGS